MCVVSPGCEERVFGRPTYVRRRLGATTVRSLDKERKDWLCGLEAKFCPHVYCDLGIPKWWRDWRDWPSEHTA